MKFIALCIAVIFFAGCNGRSEAGSGRTTLRGVVRITDRCDRSERIPDTLLITLELCGRNQNATEKSLKILSKDSLFQTTVADSISSWLVKSVVGTNNRGICFGLCRDSAFCNQTISDQKPVAVSEQIVYRIVCSCY